MSSRQCNCPWDKDPEYECGNVAIVHIVPLAENELGEHCVPTLYCKRHLLEFIEAEDWHPRKVDVLPKKKLPKDIHGPFLHAWYKVNLVTRSDMTDLMRCRKCGKEKVCRGLYRPPYEGCIVPGKE